MHRVLRDNLIRLACNHYLILKQVQISNHRGFHQSLSRNFSFKNGDILSGKRLLQLKPVDHQTWQLLSSSSPSKKRAFFSWKSFLISGILVSVFAGYMYQMKNEKLRKMERQRKKALGETAIGGKFDLIDQDGKRFTSNDLEGKWAMIYFGFTHCPDVCPDELEKIVNALDLIEASKGADPIIPVFITVDPERDSVAAVREYIREFSPKFIGLTGTKEQVDQATRAYRVYYSAGPRDHENDYIVDHTIITYLINPEGHLVDYYGQTKSAEDVAQGVLKAMKNYKSLNRRLGFL